MIVTVKPTLRGRDRIMNEIKIEVSVPSAAAVGGAFALDKFETTSTTICAPGETILVAGLLQTLENRFKEKTPLLGDIPILSHFFAEKKTSKQNKELIVMVTPRPIFASAGKGRAYSEDRKALLEESEEAAE